MQWNGFVCVNRWRFKRLKVANFLWQRPQIMFLTLCLLVLWRHREAMFGQVILQRLQVNVRDLSGGGFWDWLSNFGAAGGPVRETPGKIQY